MADRLKLLVSRYRFLSLNEKLLLADVSGSAEQLRSLKKADIETIIGRRLKIGGNSLDICLNDALNAEKILASEPINCLFFDDPGYPAQLAEIFNPPYALYYRGNLPDWSLPAVAVVGTRAATGGGLDAAFSLGHGLAGINIPVISGLAFGIDAAAHSGCVAAGGKTVAVLGAGPERVYPVSNGKIAAGILTSGGCLLSEYLPGEKPARHHFPERNRLISGLSRGVVVVEAPARSGALITADFALEQGRDLFFHSRAGRQGGAGGADRYIADGAPQIESAEDILLEWGISLRKKAAPATDTADTSAQAGQLLSDMLRRELEGSDIKFNGNYFRRACYESSYSINS